MATEELYPGFAHESPYEEAKQMRNLDSIELSETHRELAKQLDRFASMRTGALDPIGGGHLVRNFDNQDGMDSIRNYDEMEDGGGNLIRDIQSGLLRSRGYMFPRQGRQNLDSIAGITFGTSKRLDSIGSGAVFGADKRNGMDEIDRSGFNTFIKKKNFDEIDRSGFDGFVKRNFDEIDRAGFNGFVKRASN